jgi:hypothetical protein
MPFYRSILITLYYIVKYLKIIYNTYLNFYLNIIR